MLELRLTRSDPVPGGETVPDMPADAQVWRDRDGVSRAYGYTHQGEHWLHLPGVGASFRFTSVREDVEAIVGESTPRALVEDAYRRRVLPLALQALGREVLHASAVRMARGAIAFCGASGAGKSTFAYELGLRGHEPLADDSLLFDIVDGRVDARQLPFAIRLGAAGGPNGSARAPKQEVVHHAGDRDPVPLAGVIVLERVEESTGADPEMDRLPRRTGFSLLLYHAQHFSVSDEPRKRLMMERFLELTARVPVYRLRFHPSRRDLPALLDLVEEAVT